MREEVLIFFCRQMPEAGFSQKALLEAAGHYLRCQGREIFPLTVLREGKPRFVQEKAPHFSVSHSGGVWSCALAPREIGFDLQKQANCSVEAIAARCFTPEERRWLKGRGREAFFELWTAKESAAKYSGIGITEFPRRSMIAGDAFLPQIRHLPLPRPWSAALFGAEEFPLRFCLRQKETGAYSTPRSWDQLDDREIALLFQ